MDATEDRTKASAESLPTVPAFGIFWPVRDKDQDARSTDINKAGRRGSKRSDTSNSIHSSSSRQRKRKSYKESGPRVLSTGYVSQITRRSVIESAPDTPARLQSGRQSKQTSLAGSGLNTPGELPSGRQSKRGSLLVTTETNSPLPSSGPQTKRISVGGSGIFTLTDLQSGGQSKQRSIVENDEASTSERQTNRASLSESRTSTSTQPTKQTPSKERGWKTSKRQAEKPIAQSAVKATSQQTKQNISVKGGPNTTSSERQTKETPMGKNEGGTNKQTKQKGLNIPKGGANTSTQQTKQTPIGNSASNTSERQTKHTSVGESRDNTSTQETKQNIFVKSGANTSDQQSKQTSAEESRANESMQQKKQKSIAKSETNTSDRQAKQTSIGESRVNESARQTNKKPITEGGVNIPAKFPPERQTRRSSFDEDSRKTAADLSSQMQDKPRSLMESGASISTQQTKQRPAAESRSNTSGKQPKQRYVVDSGSNTTEKQTKQRPAAESGSNTSGKQPKQRPVVDSGSNTSEVQSRQTAVGESGASRSTQQTKQNFITKSGSNTSERQTKETSIGKGEGSTYKGQTNQTGLNIPQGGANTSTQPTEQKPLRDSAPSSSERQTKETFVGEGGANTVTCQTNQKFTVESGANMQASVQLGRSTRRSSFTEEILKIMADLSPEAKTKQVSILESGSNATEIQSKQTSIAESEDNAATQQTEQRSIKESRANISETQTNGAPVPTTQVFQRRALQPTNTTTNPFESVFGRPTKQRFFEESRADTQTGSPPGGIQSVAADRQAKQGSTAECGASSCTSEGQTKQRLSAESGEILLEALGLHSKRAEAQYPASPRDGIFMDHVEKSLRSSLTGGQVLPPPGMHWPTRDKDQDTTMKESNKAVKKEIRISDTSTPMHSASEEQAKRKSLPESGANTTPAEPSSEGQTKRKSFPESGPNTPGEPPSRGSKGGSLSLPTGAHSPLNPGSGRQTKRESMSSALDIPGDWANREKKRESMSSARNTPVEWPSGSRRNSRPLSPHAYLQQTSSRSEVRTSVELRGSKVGADEAAAAESTQQQTDSADTKRKELVSKMTEKYPTDYASAKLTDAKQVKVLVKQIPVEPDNLSEDAIARLTSNLLVHVGAEMKRASLGTERRVLIVSRASSTVNSIAEVEPRPCVTAHPPVKKVHKLQPCKRPEPRLSVASHVVRAPARDAGPGRGPGERRENLTELFRGRLARRRRQQAMLDKVSASKVRLDQCLQQDTLSPAMTRRHRLEQSLAADVMRARAVWEKRGLLEARAKVKVVVVGAGLAGLSAAAELVRRGFSDVTVLEASNRIGGRLHTINLGGDNPETRCSVELGAPPFVCDDSADSVYSLARANQLVGYSSLYTRPQCLVMTSEGRLLDESLVTSALRFCQDSDRDAAFLFTNGLSTSQRERACLSYTDFIRTRRRHLPARLSGNSDLDLAVDSVTSMWRASRGDNRGDSAAVVPGLQPKLSQNQLEPDVTSALPLQSINPSLTSMRRLSRGVGGQEVRLPRLLQLPSCARLCEAVAQGFPVRTVRLGERVSRLDWSSFSSKTVRSGRTPRVKVRCASGRSYEADHVIVAVPLGHLKKFAGSIFEPGLPDNKTAAIGRMGVGFVSKILLHYTAPTWRRHFHLVWAGRKPDEAGYDARSLSSRCLQITTSPSTLSVLEVTLLGEIPARAAADDAHVFSEVSAILSHKLPAPPPPDHVIRSSWGDDPHYIGSHPYLRSGCYSKDLARLARPVNFREKPVLQFAGDFTWPNYGRLTHAARASGLREAQRLTNFYDDYFGHENINTSYCRNTKAVVGAV